MIHLNLMCNLSPLSDVLMYQNSPISCSIKSMFAFQIGGVNYYYMYL